MEKEITVYTACVRRNGKILLIQRNEPECKKAHLRWEFPGGKPKKGETPQQVVVRETKEETGVTIEVERILPYASVNIWDYPWGKQKTNVYYLFAQTNDETVITHDHHVKKTRWVLPEDIYKMNTLPGLKKVIRRFVSR